MNTVFNRRTVLMAAAPGASTTLLQACGGGDDEPQRNIVETAQNNPDLSILVLLKFRQERHHEARSQGNHEL